MLAGSLSCIFRSIDVVKAGFLVKQQGVWYRKAEGKDPLSLGELGLLQAASQAYRKWKSQRQKSEGDKRQRK